MVMISHHFAALNHVAVTWNLPTLRYLLNTVKLTHVLWSAH